jgi:hypothetical protein
MEQQIVIPAAPVEELVHHDDFQDQIKNEKSIIKITRTKIADGYVYQYTRETEPLMQRNDARQKQQGTVINKHIINYKFEHPGKLSLTDVVNEIKKIKIAQEELRKI